MGIITDLIYAARLGAAERDNNEEARQEILNQYQDLHEYHLRGERRVARICNRLFGWDIPDDLKE